MLVQRNDVASSTTVIDATMLVKRDTVTALSVEERNNVFKTKFVEHTGFCGNVDTNSFVISETSSGYVVSAQMLVNELTNNKITVNISDPEFEEDNICSLVTKKFQKKHGAPYSNAKITMTDTHHTMHADVRNPTMIPFRMAVLVTDRDDITDYQLDLSEAFGNANPSSGDDAGGSGNDDAESSGDDRDSDNGASYTSRSFLEEVDGVRDEDEASYSDNSASYTSRSFLEEVDGARDEDEAGFFSHAENSQPTGPCSMCGAIGPSGEKCEVGSDCNSDAGGTYA